jgi:hypothetical protein
VVSDGSLRYFLHDGGEVTQVAQLVDPGVDVAAVIEIGVSLGSLYEQLPVTGLANGKAVKAAEPAKATALPGPPKAPAERYFRQGITTEEVVAYIRKHPGVRTTMIAADLLPGKARPGATGARQTIDNRLRSLVAKHEAAGTECPVHKRVIGPQHSVWYPGPASDRNGDVSGADVTEV